MGQGDLVTFEAGAAGAGADRPFARSPPDDEQAGVGIGVHLERRNLIGDARDLRLPQGRHAGMVGSLVGDVSGDVRLLQATDAVLKALGPR